MPRLMTFAITDNVQLNFCTSDVRNVLAKHIRRGAVNAGCPPLAPPRPSGRGSSAGKPGESGHDYNAGDDGRGKWPSN